MNITRHVYGLGRKKKRRFEQLEQMETKYNEMVPQFKRLEEEVPKLQAENKKAELELEEMKSKLRANENELQEAKRNFIAQKAYEESMRQLFLDVVKSNAQNVDGFVQSEWNGTANFELSMAYQQIGSGLYYSNNASYTAVGPSYVANHGVLTGPDSLGGNSVFYPANNLENYVKGKSSASVDKFRDLFSSQNYVPDGQVPATSATGLQIVDGFVQSVWNRTANFEPSMAYQQIGSGQDYSKNAAYTAVGPSSVANHGSVNTNKIVSPVAGSSSVANGGLPVVSDTQSNHHGVLTVPGTSFGANSEIVFDPASIPNYSDDSTMGLERWFVDVLCDKDLPVPAL